MLQQSAKDMMKRNELAIIKAIALCYKPYLKPEEAMIYCNLGRTQLIKNCEGFGIYKNEKGYYKREDLEAMMNGGESLLIKAVKRLKM